MKNLKILAVAVLATGLFSCKKEMGKSPVKELDEGTVTNATAACQPGYYNLALDNVGKSYVYKVSGSPSAGPVVVSPIIGSNGDNIVGSSSPLTTVFKMTGLSYDPTTGTAWGLTGNAGNFPNSLIKFSIGDPNVVGIVSLTTACGINLDLSDIERDPTTGRYYAINRGTANPDNRIVVIDITTGIVNCLPNFIPVPTALRGLTFGCNGQLYVLNAVNTTGKVLQINKATGAIIGSWAYPGVITPGGVGAPEMGLHFDCSCINQFITGSFTGGPLLTDGLPAGLGGPLYNSLLGVIKPTVDFARP